MPSISEILTIEKRRDLTQVPFEVHLFVDGTFLRAYEYSAWFYVSYFTKLKVTRKKVKNSDDTFVYIGFPQTSLAKYTPENSDVEQIDEKHYIIHFPETIYADGFDIEHLERNFENWKQAIPPSEPKKSKTPPFVEISSHEEPCVSVHSPSMFGIMHEIMVFPLENKSPLECMRFVAHLRELVSQLI